MQHRTLGKIHHIRGTLGGPSPGCIEDVQLAFDYVHDLVTEIAVTEAAGLTILQAGIKLPDCHCHQRYCACIRITLGHPLTR